MAASSPIFLLDAIMRKGNKTMKSLLFVALALCSFNIAYAGPMVSGGTQETQFQHDLAAIRTILSSEDVFPRLTYAGKIQQIAPIADRRDVFAVVTEKCELHVKFERPCDFSTGLPRCDYNAIVLLEESIGDCGK